jgi:rRNA maturation protein Nop10
MRLAMDRAGRSREAATDRQVQDGTTEDMMWKVRRCEVMSEFTLEPGDPDRHGAPPGVRKCPRCRVYMSGAMCD